MTQELFKKIKTSELIQVISEKLEAISFDTLRSPAIIQAKQEALRVWEAYGPKDPSGKPIEPSLAGADCNRFVEIEITQTEAEVLGVSGTRVSVHDLWALVSVETGTLTPAGSGRRDRALHLLENGTKHCDAYSAALANYAAASQAYNLLSKPVIANPRDAEVLATGGRFLKVLKDESPGPHVLLTEKEYGALTSGAFDKLDGQKFLPAEQRHRHYTNQCVTHSFQEGADFPFKVFVDPEKMASIETIMRVDSTSSWLLEAIKKNNTPVILHEYTVPDSAFVGKALNLGTHFVHPQFRSSPGAAPVDIEYIRLFVNVSNNFDIASVYSHEGRHFWQRRVISDLEQNRASPIDNIILGMLREADAFAVQAKVDWSLGNKLGQWSMHSPVKEGFKNTFSDPAHTGLSHAARLKKATQAEFLAFLEKEFSKPSYLKDFIEEYIGTVSPQLINSGVCNRLLSCSPFLTTEFLRRITQVGPANPYLDEEGTRRVAGLIREKLPQALAQYKPPASAPGSAPSL